MNDFHFGEYVYHGVGKITNLNFIIFMKIKMKGSTSTELSGL